MRKFFLRRFKQYFLIMIIPTLVFFLVCLGISYMQIEADLDAAAEQSRSKLQDNYDFIVNSLLEQHVRMMDNPQLSLALRDLLGTSVINYSNYLFTNSLKAILTSIVDSHEYIHSIYLYLDSYPAFFSSKDRVCSVSAYTDLGWLGRYQEQSRSTEVWMETRTIERDSFSEPLELLTVYKRMGTVSGVIVLNLDKAKYLTAIDGIYEYKDENLLLFSNDGPIMSRYSLEEEDIAKLSYAVSGKSPRWQRLSSGFYYVKAGMDDEAGLCYVSCFPLSVMLELMRGLLMLFCIILLLNCALVLSLAYYTTKRSFVQINNVINSLRKAEEGEAPAELSDEYHDEFDLILNKVLLLFLDTTVLNNKLKEQEYQQKVLELETLQMQINPHFLFNTLQTANMEALSLSSGRPTTVNTILEELSDILKYALGNPEEMVTLAEELEYVKKYVRIQNIRFDDQIIMYYDIDEKLLGQRLMRLTLQPLIENSISHGIRPLGTSGCVTLTVRQEGARMELAVEDTGIGMDEEKLDDLRRQITSRTRGGIGLSNVNRRLILRFGEESTLRITSKENEGTTVSFSLPLG